MCGCVRVCPRARACVCVCVSSCDRLISTASHKSAVSAAMAVVDEGSEGPTVADERNTGSSILKAPPPITIPETPGAHMTPLTTLSRHPLDGREGEEEQVTVQTLRIPHDMVR